MFEAIRGSRWHPTSLSSCYGTIRALLVAASISNPSRHPVDLDRRLGAAVEISLILPCSVRPSQPNKQTPRPSPVRPNSQSNSMASLPDRDKVDEKTPLILRTLIFLHTPSARPRPAANPPAYKRTKISLQGINIHTSAPVHQQQLQASEFPCRSVAENCVKQHPRYQ